MGSCEAVPLEGRTHSGTVRSYVRICPAGHFRAALVRGSCAGNGVIICGDCLGEDPALLIRTRTWSALLSSAPERTAHGNPRVPGGAALPVPAATPPRRSVRAGRAETSPQTTTARRARAERTSQ